MDELKANVKGEPHKQQHTQHSSVKMLHLANQYLAIVTATAGRIHNRQSAVCAVLPQVAVALEK